MQRGPRRAPCQRAVRLSPTVKAEGSTPGQPGGYDGERRSRSASRGGVAWPFAKCSEHLCSDVGLEHRG
jgi:hypothetical protein